jgi:O-antigen ligase
MAAGGEMFRDRPLLGVGPGAYGLLYSQYSGNYPIEAVHSHNGYLQTAVDMGLAGVGVMIVAAGAAGAALWWGLRRASTQERLLLVACGASLAGFLVHSLAEAPNASKTVLVPLAVVLALWRGCRPVSKTPFRLGCRTWWPGPALMNAKHAWRRRLDLCLP